MLVVSKLYLSSDMILSSSNWSSDVPFSVPFSLLKTSKNCEMGPSLVEDPTTTKEPGILKKNIKITIITTQQKIGKHIF